jgi:anti-anti-sigma factor
METQNGRQPAPESSGALVRTDRTAIRTPAGEPRVLEPPHVSAVPKPLRIFESTADGRRVIAPCGELDLSTASQLEERLAGNRDTVLDLSDLSFIDSTGIHVMLNTALRARSEAWEFTVRNAQPAVLRVIRLVGLAEHLGLGTQAPPEEDAEQASSLT